MAENEKNKGIKSRYDDSAALDAKTGTRAEDNSKLGSMPVGRLVVSMSAPMMLSFFIQALYNIVDSMFVAKISENALAAVSLAFPLQGAMNAIAVGLAVGMSAAIPRAVAAGRPDKAARVAGTGIFLNMSCWALFVMLGIFVAGRYFAWQTDIAEIASGGTVYLRICWIISGGVLFGQYFEKMLLASGDSVKAMISMACGAVFNIIFDPLLIFGIGPFPELGIAGAAIATVAGQVFAAVVAFTFNRRLTREWKVTFADVMRPTKEAAGAIASVGFPSTVTIGLASVSGFCVNQALLSYSVTATAVYGIWQKLQNFCFMPSFGMNNALIPVLSYNHSKGNTDRVHHAMRFSIVLIIVLMLIETCIFELIPRTLLTLFSASENMMNIGVRALRICVISLTAGGTSIVLASQMQAMNKSSYALAINILRQFVFPVSLFFGLSAAFHDVGAVWWAVPATEALSLVVSLVLLKKSGLTGDFAADGYADGE
ncbi:MAG: MATE family efflux transporter [Eubacterium sp.]|jgi:putative MATE family efflux protein